MICPKCGIEFKEHPALSRVDSKTKICSLCGTKEALDVAINNGAMKQDDANSILKMINKVSKKES